MAIFGLTTADWLFDQVHSRGGRSGSGCIEQNSPSSVGYPSSQHQHKYHGTPDPWCRGMEGGGVRVIGGRRIFRSTCKRPSRGSQSNRGGGKLAVSAFKRNTPSEQHGASQTIRTRLWPSFRRDTRALCIPLDMRSNIMSEHHDSPPRGAPQGTETTAAAIWSWFYWPHSTQNILAWVRGCDVCNRVKYVNQLPNGSLQLLTVPETRASSVTTH